MTYVRSTLTDDEFVDEVQWLVDGNSTALDLEAAFSISIDSIQRRLQRTAHRLEEAAAAEKRMRVRARIERREQVARALNSRVNELNVDLRNPISMAS